mgnify:FL=1
MVASPGLVWFVGPGAGGRGGVTTVVVRGSSMAPTFHDGDPESGWHTAGDGNTFVDRWVVHRDDALGTLWFVVPRAGHVVEWLLDHPAVAGAGGVARSGRRPRGGRRAATRQPVGPVAADSDRARRARRDGGAHVGEWSADALRQIAEDVGENVLHHTSLEGEWNTFVVQHGARRWVWIPVPSPEAEQRGADVLVTSRRARL